MVVCSVLGCDNFSEKECDDKNIRFHSFPKDAKIRKLWLSACGDGDNINEFPLDHGRVCSEHFLDSDYRLQDELLNLPAESKRCLKLAAVPSINVPIARAPSSRAKRQKRRSNNECLDDLEKRSCQTPSKCKKPQKQDDHGKESPQTEAEQSSSDKLNIIELNKEVRKLKRSLKRMKQKEQNEDDKMSTVKKIFTSRK